MVASPVRHVPRCRCFPLVVVAAALLSVILLLLPPCFVSAAVTACSNGGTLLSTGVCSCPQGALGADCSILSTAAAPIYRGAFTSTLGMGIMQEWRIETSGSGAPQLRMRWAAQTQSWFGAILDWDGMTSGDCWVFYVTSAQAVYLGDMFSADLSQPSYDAAQDLTVVSGWNDGNWSVVEFTRLLNTGDAGDKIIANTPGTGIRFMWTYGLSGVGSGGKHGASAATGALTNLGMHGYIGKAGQYKVDFVGGTFEVLKDGVEWPTGYYAALGIGCGLFVLFGLLLQRSCVERSGLGRVLRSHPLSLRADPSKAKPEHSSPAWYHRVTFDVIPALRGCSIQEMIIGGVYVGALAAVIQTSLAQYDAVGRSGMYVLGHLASMHLALAILPVSRNSVFLWACRVPFDTAVRWHRRFGSMAVLWTFVHGATMLKIWNAAVLFYVSDCQFGGAALFGTLSMVCLIGLLVSSAEWVRRSHYEWFLYAHVVFVAGAYVFALLHSVQFRWLLLVPGVLYCIDVLMRVCLSPYVVFGGAVALRPEDQSSPSGVLCSSAKARLVRVQCLGSSDARAMHDRVLILTFRMAHSVLLPSFPAGSWIELRSPQLSRLQSHPYTISSSMQNAHGVTIMVHVRAMEAPTSASTWSQQLWELAAAALPAGTTDFNFDLMAARDGSPRDEEAPLPAAERRRLAPRAGSAVVLRAPFQLTLCGPYAGLYVPVLEYRVVVLVGGGIGITPLMARLEEFIRRADERQAAQDGANNTAARSSAARSLPLRVYVLWSARSLDAFRLWFPSLMSRLSSSDCAAASRVHLQLHCTNPRVGLERLEREFDLVAEMPNSSRATINQAAAAIELPRNRSAEPPNASPRDTVIVQVEPTAAAEAYRASASAGTLPSSARGYAADSGAAAAAAPNGQPPMQMRVLKAYDSQRSVLIDEAEANTPEADGRDHDVPAAAATAAFVPVVASGLSSFGPGVLAAHAPRRSASSRVPIVGVRRLPQLHRARPNMVSFLDRVERELSMIPADNATAFAASSSLPLSASDVFVLSCGPSSLISAAEAEAQRRGMHYAHEGFEW